MFFTQEDYKKIQEWLTRNAIKDTEFNEAVTPLNGNETIAFVQNGHNVKAFLKDFIAQLTLLGVSDFLNVTEKYGERNISLNQAIQLIPFKSRKIGQVITFLSDNNKWEIYQFQGERVNQWNTESLWIDLIQEFIGATVEADEEDLTGIIQNDKTVLKFKDKPYNEDDFSGLGKIYLRKNVTEVTDSSTGARKRTNLLTQRMLGNDHTVYIIQYDYDLNGQTITVPENSVLDFKNGGNFSNGTINCVDTTIRIDNFDSLKVPLTGTYTVVEALNEDKSPYMNDTEYNVEEHSGLGHVYLRKNKGVLTQNNFTKSNTIYHIRYDYDLQGKEITIPEGCILKFEGGSLNNGTVICTDTKINEEYKGTAVLSGDYIFTALLDTISKEDIDIYDNELKLADREYLPEKFSGLGYKILRRNIVDGVNILSQEMISNANTVYIIRYDFDLNGAEITIPENCVLDFQGGSLKNGKIVGNRTSIQSFLFNIFGLNIEFGGNWNLGEVYIEWFGGGENKTAENNSDAIEKSITLLSKNGGCIKLNGHIYTSRSIDLRDYDGICIEGTFTNLCNPLQNWNTIIIKTGDYDAVILGNYGGIKNIGISSKAEIDTHDGLWVAGFGCVIDNIGVNDQGGNGIKVGSKIEGEDRLVDCCYFYAVKSIHNKGWGLYISDEQILNDNPSTADCNANSFFGIDIRDNTLGGIYINKCIDNHFFSPIVHVNGRDSSEPITADIYIDSLTKGNHFYSPYCESSNARYGIYIAKGSSSNRVVGQRTDGGNFNIFDANEEDGWSAKGYNYTERYNRNYRGKYIPSFVNYEKFCIVNPNYAVGPCSMELSDNGILKVGTKALSLKNPSSSESSIIEQQANGLIKMPDILSLNIMGEENYYGIRIKNDMINNIKVRAYCATKAVNVPANSTLEVTTTTNLDDQCYGHIISNPGDGPLPSGISYYTRQEKAGELKFYFVNSTSDSVSIPKTRWNILFLGTIILV